MTCISNVGVPKRNRRRMACTIERRDPAGAAALEHPEVVQPAFQRIGEDVERFSAKGAGGIVSIGQPPQGDQPIAGGRRGRDDCDVPIVAPDASAALSPMSF